MEAHAIARNIRISPRKVALVADSIRKKSVKEAYGILSILPKRAAQAIEKVLHSAASNAVTTKNMKEETLSIASITVTQGQAFKRFRPSTKGRIHPYKKRGSIITIVLEGGEGK